MLLFFVEETTPRPYIIEFSDKGPYSRAGQHRGRRKTNGNELPGWNSTAYSTRENPYSTHSL